MRTHAKINTPHITPDMVKKKIKELNPDKAPGPDGIHPKLLKELLDIVPIPLAIIFQKSLVSGLVPSDWKHGNV